MKKHIVLATIGALLLGACSQSDTPAEDAENAAEASGETAGADETTGNATASSDDTATIPAAFHGVWDYVEGSCAPESDLRVEVKPQMVIFYESLGTVEAVTTVDEQTVSVTLAMEGEGETWETTRVFTLIKDGAGMTQSDAPAGAGYDPFELKRCE